MNFIEQYKTSINGILHAFDRIVLHGQLRTLIYPTGIYYWLQQNGRVLMKDYKTFAMQQTQTLNQHIEQYGLSNGVNKIHYVNNSKSSKEAIARQYFKEHSTQKGLVAIISSKESSYAFTARKNKQSGFLEMRRELRVCLHYYLYFMDEEFGWMHVRIQSWFPNKIQIYLNGKEYLKQQLRLKGIDFDYYNNSVTWVEDMEQAQNISNQLVQKSWNRFLNAFAAKVNPHYQNIQKIMGSAYEWYIHQAEYACDVLFKEREILEQLYPAWVQYSTLFRGGEDVYTFFGRNITARTTKELIGSQKKFTQGFRVKHTLDKNSIKMYDKGKALRIETTINNARAFKKFKIVNTKSKNAKPYAWVPMGKHVSNLYRYAQVAQYANMRYLNSLCAAPVKGLFLKKNMEKLSQAIQVKSKKGNTRNFSGFNLLSKSSCLIFEAISDAKFCIRPFSNKQLREVLLEKGFFNSPSNQVAGSKKIANQTTRLLAKLRAHKLIVKVNKSFRYKVSANGLKIISKIFECKQVAIEPAHKLS